MLNVKLIKKDNCYDFDKGLLNLIMLFHRNQILDGDGGSLFHYLFGNLLKMVPGFSRRK